MEDLVYELNFESAKIAKKLTQEYTQKNKNKPRFVAGSIGPTNKTASISPDVNDPGYRAITFDELVSSYSEQIKGLIKGGVDILLVETIFDTLNAKAALFAIDTYLNENNLDMPIMVSGTITDQSGRTLSGQTVKAFLYSLSHMPILSIGFNCALGAKQLIPYIKTLSENAPFFISAYPNAGLPNVFGQYDQTPSEMSSQIKNYLDDNLVNIIGGCCGTDENFIKEIPNLKRLSSISDQKLMKRWEGLGYYSRARNLKKTAKKILSNFNGNLPSTKDDLKSLPGIGEYTSSAIMAIAFNKPIIPLDGNVERVLKRVLYLKKNMKFQKKIYLRKNLFLAPPKDLAIMPKP